MPVWARRAAWRSMLPMTTLTAAPRPDRRCRTCCGRASSRATSRTSILGLPIGIASFTVAVTGVSLAAGLLITLLGIPVLLLTLVACRAFAAVERARAAYVLGEPIAAPERTWKRDGVWETTKADRQPIRAPGATSCGPRCSCRSPSPRSASPSPSGAPRSACSPRRSGTGRCPTTPTTPSRCSTAPRRGGRSCARSSAWCSCRSRSRSAAAPPLGQAKATAFAIGKGPGA